MRGTRAFRVATTSARVLTGATVAVACVAAVVAAVAVPWPSVEQAPAQAQITPLPGDTVLVCNGDFRALGRIASNASQMVSAGVSELTAGGTEQAASVRLEASDLAGGSGPEKFTGVVADRRAPLIAATESVALAATDLAGLAAAPCREARTESWLVGGSVATGTKDLVILTNPGEVTATVTLTVYGGTTMSSSSAIVPAGKQVAVPLGSIAAGAQAPVVKVASEGSAVRAVLQSSFVRTLDPAGIDLQDAVTGPQQEQVIAGVQVFANDGDDTDMTVLRMLAPDADSNAEVVVRPMGEKGAPSTELSVPLTAGNPTEVSLGDLAAGAYSVEVRSDAPALAAVRQRDGTGSGSDFAWVTPAPEIDGEVLSAVPAGPSPQIHLLNRGDAEVTVDLTPTGGGAAQSVTVPANGSAIAALSSETSYALAASAPVHAAVTMTAEGALAAWPLWPSAGVEQSITVYP